MRFIRGLIGLVLVLTAGCVNNAPPSAETKTSAADKAAAQPAQSPVERGKYLVTVGGCNDCHTPKKLGPNGPEPNMDLELSGNPSTEKLAPVPVGLIAPDKYLTVVNNHLGAGGGPWGVRFAMELQRDKSTGLGSCAEKMFMTTSRPGT